MVILAILSIVAVVIILFVSMTTALAREDAEFLRRFQQAFPNQCFVCSYHRYGVRHGHTSGPVPDHDCAETDP